MYKPDRRCIYVSRPGFIFVPDRQPASSSSPPYEGGVAAASADGVVLYVPIPGPPATSPPADRSLPAGEWRVVLWISTRRSLSTGTARVSSNGLKSADNVVRQVKRKQKDRQQRRHGQQTFMLHQIVPLTLTGV